MGMRQYIRPVIVNQKEDSLVTKKIIKHPILAILILFALFAVAWAAANLSGQANRIAADSASISADMEMANLDAIKPSPQANCDWGLERNLHQQLANNTNNYSTLVKRAQQETDNAGAVSSGTANQLVNSAAEFKRVSEQYAQMWEKCNAITRAKLAREVAESRVASAKVVAYGADSDNASALNDAQERMNQARSAYIDEAIANNELSAADKSNLQSTLIPKVEGIVKNTTALVQATTSLLDDIRSQASPSAAIGGLGGCLSRGGGQTAASNDASSLLSPVTSLLSLAKGLAGNAGSLLEDLTRLAK
jgi:hypothetical protein